jgi:hypothetical protein
MLRQSLPRATLTIAPALTVMAHPSDIEFRDHKDPASFLSLIAVSSTLDCKKRPFLPNEANR